MRKHNVGTWTRSHVVNKSLGKDLCNSRKLGKVLAIYKTNKQTSSFQKVNVFKILKKVQKVAFTTSQLNSASGITLTNDKYRRKNSHSITVRSCFRTHLTLFIYGVCRSVHPSFVNGVSLKTYQLFCA